MDKMREEFEAWAEGFMWLERMIDGSYKSATTKKMWECWQASRQALVVEFTSDTYFSPCKTELELASDEGFKSAMKDVKAALDAAGVSYK